MDKDTKKKSPPGPAVGPIESLDDINRLSEYLASQPRDLLLFEMAVRTGLEMFLLLELKVRDVKYLQVGETRQIVSPSTAKSGMLTMVDVVRRALDRYLADVVPNEGDYLFKSRKGSGPLSLSSASHLVRNWFQAVGLKQRGGVLVLRKTHRLHFSGYQPERPTHPSPDIRGAALKPVKEKKTLQEIVYRKIFKAIVQGKISTHERIVIEHLAKQLNVSRIPVREALHRLEAIGLLAQYNKGLMVAQLSYDDYVGLTEVRLLLETKATELAAELRTDEEMEELERLHLLFLESLSQYDVDAHIKYNRLFHHTIYRAARRPILYQTIEGLWDRVSPYIYLMVRDEKIDSPDYHEGVLEAIRRRDPEKARRGMWMDIEKGAEVVAKYLKLIRSDETL